MKKLISLTLVLFLCISLSACSSKDDPDSGHDLLLKYLADEEYDLAIQYIEQLQTESYAIDSTGEENADSHPLLPKLYGDWIYHTFGYNLEIEVPCTAITFNEDGTCIADGRTGYWKISEESSSDFLRVDIYENDAPTISIGYIPTNDSIAVWPFDYYGAVDYVWINTSRYEIREVTTENWKEYFDLSLDEEYTENAFGEVERLVLVQKLKLKDQYHTSIGNTAFVVEISSNAQRQYITLDALNRSYTLGDKIEDVALNAEIFECWDTIPVFGNNYINAEDNANPDSHDSKTVILVQSIDDITIHRIMGYVFIEK